jgi:hypothetical protein
MPALGILLAYFSPLLLVLQRRFGIMTGANNIG